MNVSRCATIVLIGTVLCMASASAAPEAGLRLEKGWRIQSSAAVSETGATISTARFQPDDWYQATVPSTIVGALATDRVFGDPYFGKNLRSIPGATYPEGANFATLRMPPGSPFRVAWWYRTEFKLPAGYHGKTVWLHFNGISYRANIWLNGRRIAGAEDVAGTFRRYEFNVTDAVVAEGTNTLAVEVFPPRRYSLALTFVDWNPASPDKGMGLWHEVFLTSSGPVAVRHLNAVTHLDLPKRNTASLTVSAELHNAAQRKVDGTLRGTIGKVQFSQKVSLQPGESRAVIFSPERFAQLVIRTPRLWWPWQYGDQPLYELKMEFVSGGKISDSGAIHFGIRQVTSELTPAGHRLFRINGKPILIRGGAWTPDMLLRPQPEKLKAELRYARDMNLNTIRLEGKLAGDEFFDFCDRNGMLVMAGWCCCGPWEEWKHWKQEDYRISAESLKDQVRRLRYHPSILVWLNGSDNPPPPEVEKTYIQILKQYDWPNPYLSSATEKKTNLTGETGVRMDGPYEYVPPIYWYQPGEKRGAYGFNTEISPGPAPPPIPSLRRMLPASHLWPIDEYWDYHAGGGKFRTINVFAAALNKRYGEAKNLGDFSRKAQLQAYETHRAMFEAFGRNKYTTATGVIQWMMNNAWPSLIWHLYDYYLRPGGSYFGAKKACEPLHIQYSYDDHSVVVVNSRAKPVWGLKAIIKVLNLDLAEKLSREVIVDAGADSSTRIFIIPAIDGLTRTYFVRLALVDGTGKLRSSNFYWLSTKPDVLEWDKSEWYYTPVKSHGDLRGLATLPEVALDITRHIDRCAGQVVVHASVSNPTRHLALGVHLRILKGKQGGELLPVLWQDNYFSLLPGESREVTAGFAAKSLGGAKPVVAVDGWNIKPSEN